MDDLLIGASTLKRLKKRIEYVLQVCKSNNAKLSPSKFDVGTTVSFGGHRISHNQESNSVFIHPSEEKIEAIKGT